MAGTKSPAKDSQRGTGEVGPTPWLWGVPKNGETIQRKTFVRVVLGKKAKSIC